MRGVLALIGGILLVGALVLGWLVLQVGEREEVFQAVVSEARANGPARQFTVSRKFEREVDAEYGRVKLHLVELEPDEGEFPMEKSVTFSRWMDLRAGNRVEALPMEDGALLFPELDAEDYGLAKLLFGSGALVLGLLAALVVFLLFRPGPRIP